MINREEPPCYCAFDNEEGPDEEAPRGMRYDNYSSMSQLSLDLQNDFELEQEREIFRLFEDLEDRLAVPPTQPLPKTDSTLLNDFNPYRLRGTQFKVMLQNAQYEEWSHVPHFRARGHRIGGTRPNSQLGITRPNSQLGITRPSSQLGITRPSSQLSDRCPSFPLGRGLSNHSLYPGTSITYVPGGSRGSQRPSYPQQMLPVSRLWQLAIRGVAVQGDAPGAHAVPEDSPDGGTVDETFAEDGEVEEVFACHGEPMTVASCLSDTKLQNFVGGKHHCYPLLPSATSRREKPATAPHTHGEKKAVRLGLGPINPSASMKAQIMHALFMRVWQDGVMPALSKLMTQPQGQAQPTPPATSPLRSVQQSPVPIPLALAAPAALVSPSPVPLASPASSTPQSSDRGSAHPPSPLLRSSMQSPSQTPRPFNPDRPLARAVTAPSIRTVRDGKANSSTTTPNNNTPLAKPRKSPTLSGEGAGRAEIPVVVDNGTGRDGAATDGRSDGRARGRKKGKRRKYMRLDEYLAEQQRLLEEKGEWPPPAPGREPIPARQASLGSVRHSSIATTGSGSSVRSRSYNSALVDRLSHANSQVLENGLPPIPNSCTDMWPAASPVASPCHFHVAPNSHQRENNRVNFSPRVSSRESVQLPMIPVDPAQRPRMDFPVRARTAHPASALSRSGIAVRREKM